MTTCARLHPCPYRPRHRDCPDRHQLAAIELDVGPGRLGAEHVAEILLWGMTGGEHMISPQIDDSDEAELEDAYEILIGG